MVGTQIQCKCGHTKTEEQLFLMHVHALVPLHIHTKAQHQQNDKIYIYFKRLYSLGRFLSSLRVNESQCSDWVTLLVHRGKGRLNFSEWKPDIVMWMFFLNGTRLLKHVVCCREWHCKLLVTARSSGQLGHPGIFPSKVMCDKPCMMD